MKLRAWPNDCVPNGCVLLQPLSNHTPSNPPCHPPPARSIPSLSTSATAASQLTADSSGRTVTTLFATLLAGVAGGITSTNSSVGSYAEKLVSLDTLATKVTSGEFDVSTLGTKVWLGGIIALGEWQR